MFFFTRQERFVLVSLVFIFCIGIVLRFAFKITPGLANIVNVMDSDYIYYKVNINTATIEDLMRIPYIGEKTAKRIIFHRNNTGTYQSIDQIKLIKGIRPQHFEKFKRYLKAQ